MGTTQNYIPTDYQDLYEVYFLNPCDGFEHSLARGLVGRFAGSVATDADAEDLVHTVFERMLRLKSLEKFNPELASFGAYLVQIIRSTVYTWHTKNGRTPTAGGLSLEGSDPRLTARPMESSRRRVARNQLSDLTVSDVAPNPEEATVARNLEARLFAIAEEEHARVGATPRGEGLGTMISILLSGGEAKEVSATMGVSASTVTHWRQYLRAELSA